jgi:adenosine kinase
VLNFADFVFGNEAEAAAWGAANGLEGASVEAVARAVAALPKAGAAGRTVVFTQGAKETVVATADGAVRTVPVDAIADAEIVDVNGAGDAFVGGFLAATAAGKDVDVACRAGNWAAGVVIRRSGCAFDASLKCPAMA